jgi:hypothetical protein
MKAIKVFETPGPRLLGSEDEGTRIYRYIDTPATIYPTKQLNNPKDHCIDTAYLHKLPTCQCQCYVNCVGRKRQTVWPAARSCVGPTIFLVNLWIMFGCSGNRAALKTQHRFPFAVANWRSWKLTGFVQKRRKAQKVSISIFSRSDSAEHQGISAQLNVCLS